MIVKLKSKKKYIPGEKSILTPKNKNLELVTFFLEKKKTKDVLSAETTSSVNSTSHTEIIRKTEAEYPVPLA